MPQNISYGTSFNSDNTFVPGLYQQVIPPTASPGGAPTSVGYVVGTRSWGKLNSPQLIGSGQQLAAIYGGMSAASVLDTHDLATDVTIFLGQGTASFGNAVWAVGVGDGTETEASVNIVDTAGVTILPTTAKWTGDKGNQISIQTASGGPGPDEYITLGGTLTTGDVVNIKVNNALLPGGSYTLSYTTVSGDTTLTLLATHITSAINANSILTAAGFTAVSSAAVITLSWPQSLQSVTIASSVNGSTTATVAGSVTTADVVTINVFDANLTGGSLSIPYTVQVSDTATLIATGLKNAINASSPLTAAGITATNSGAILTLKSVSTSQTTYTRTLSAGATETVTFAAGPTETVTLVRVDSVNMIVVPYPGGGAVESFNGLSGIPANFPAAAAAALSNGLNAARGPSRFVVPGTPAPSALGPRLGQVVMSGGTDGRASVTTAQLLGSSSAVPPTGIFAAQNLQFIPSIIWIAGLLDPNAYATIQSFCGQNNIAAMFTFAPNTDTADAVSAKFSYGIADYQIMYVKDYQYFNDTVNGVTRLVSPLPFACGTICSLPPWESPLNKGIKLSVGTERDNRFTGSVPYSYSELSQLGQAGIMLIQNGIPRGPIIGFENGYNSIGNNDPAAYVEYTRMTNYIVATNASVLGKYIGELNGFDADDTVRSQIEADLSTFLGKLKKKKRIGPFSVVCSLANNDDASLGAHEVQIDEKVKFLPSIQTIFTTTQGGTTVEIADPTGAN